MFSTTTKRGFSFFDVEETLGTNWLNKLGVTSIVFGIAFFLAYQLGRLGPVGKIAVGYVTGAVLLGLGLYTERKERYRVLARAMMGGGWATLFLTTYAMHNVAATRIVTSEALDLVLMFIVAAAMTAHTLRYNSQTVTGLAFVLGFLTVATSHVSVFSLSAGVVLALGLVVVVLHRSWFEVEIGGIAASYFNHYLWLRPIIKVFGAHRLFPEFWTSAAILLFYWAIYRASYLLRRIDSDIQERYSSIAAILNATLLVAIFKYQSVRPELAFWGLLVLGSVEMALGQLRLARRRRSAFVVLTVLGTVLLVSAVPFRYSGNEWSIFWLIAAEALFAAGLLTREAVFARLGLITAGVASLRLYYTTWQFAFSGHGGEIALASTLLLGAGFFYADAHWLARRWSDVLRGDFELLGIGALSLIATAMLAAGIWAFHPGAWTVVGWAAGVLALAYFGRALDSITLWLGGTLLAGATVIRMLLWNLPSEDSLGHIHIRVITGALVAVALYAASAWNALPRLKDSGIVRAAYTWSASALVALLAWNELSRLNVVVAWTVLGLILFEAGCLRRNHALRLQAYTALFFAFAVLFSVSPPASEIQRVYRGAPLAVALFYVYCRLVRFPHRSELEAGLRTAEWHAWLGSATVTQLVHLEVPVRWVAAGYSMLVLALVALALLTKRRVFLYQGLVLSGLVVFVGVAGNLYNESYFFNQHIDIWSTAAAAAILFGTLPIAFRLRRPAPEVSETWLMVRQIAARPEQVLFFLPLTLTTWLLGRVLPHGMKTIGWGIEGVAVFLVALWIGERSFRLSGLGLLLLCVARIVLIDAWSLHAAERYVTFIVLGIALLLVSYFYTRYRELLKNYL